MKRKMWIAVAALAVATGGAGAWFAYDWRDDGKTARPENSEMKALLDQIREQQRTDSRKPGGTDPSLAKPNNEGQAPPNIPYVQNSAPAVPLDPPKQTMRVMDLNAATLEQLMELPGIGESKAKAIIELREKLGGFQNVEQLTEVKGIGEKTFQKLRPFIRVGPPDR